MFKLRFVLGLICLISYVSGRPQQVYLGAVGSAAIPYDFSYKVENPPTNTFFGQNEVGNVAGGKTGSYYVLLPDGKWMTVDYTADAQGYFPKISYQTGARAANLG